MPVKPRWIARFAAFAILGCRDLPGSIDRMTDRTRNRNQPAIADPSSDEVGPLGSLGAHDLSAIRSPNGQDQVPALAPFKSASLNQWLVTALVSVKNAMPSSPMQCRSP